MANEEIKIEIAADSAQAVAAFGRLGAAGREAANNLTGEFNKISSTVERVNGLFAKMASAIILGFSVDTIVQGTRSVAKYADEVDKSSQKTGIATDKLQGLQFAAKMSDISSQDLDTSLRKLAKAMEEASAGGAEQARAFEAIGIKASDLKNMKTEDVLAKIADAFARSKDGAGKAAVSMALFGKAGTEMIPFLNKGSASIDELVAKAKKLGLVMGGPTLEAAGQLDDQFKLMDAQIEGVHKRMSIALVPSFLQGTAAIVQMTEKGGAMEGLFSELNVILLWLAKMASYVAQAFNAMGKTIGATAAAIASALHGDFSMARKIMAKGNKDIEESTKRFEALRATLAKPINTPSVTKKTDPNKTDIHLGDKGADKADSSRMSAWESELAQIKVVTQIQNNLRDFTKAEEVKFWQDKLALSKKGSTEEISVSKKLAETQLAILKLKAQQTKALNLEEIENNKDIALDAVAVDEQAANQKLAMHQITQAQMIGLQRQYEQRRYDIQVEAQAQRIQALLGDPNYDPVALQILLDDMAGLHRKHAMDESKITGDAALNQQKEMEGLLAPIASAFDTSIKGMILGTTTLKSALSNIWKSILAEFVNMTVKMGMQWAATELVKTHATQLNVGLRALLEKAGLIKSTMAQDAASIETVATKADEATGVVGANAAEAASGAAASQAAIPIVGWGLAATAFAGTMAMVMGATSSIPSARGGYDIPSGINPLTQLHEREMVLPAAHADVIRSMAGGGGGTIINNMSATVITPDADSFRASKDQIAGELYSQMRPRRGA